MPLDTRIALGVQPLQLADPLARESQVQNILASQAQQRAAGMQQQSAQMQMDQTQRQLRQDEDYVSQMADAIGKNGGPPDMEKAARLMATNRNPDVSRQGVIMLQSLQRLDAAKKAGIYGAPAAPASEAAAAAPVIPNAGPAPGALGSGTYGMDQNVPMFNQPNVPPLNLTKPTVAPAPAPAPVMNQLTPPAAAPVNQLGVTPKVDAIKALETRYATLAQFSDLPGVKEQMTLLGEQYKALLNQRNTAFAPIDASKYTPASLKAFNLSGDQSDLVAVTKAEKIDSPFGKIDPDKFTPKSLAKYAKSNDFNDLVLAPKEPKERPAPRTQQVTLSDGSLGIMNMDTGAVTAATLGGAPAMGKDSSKTAVSEQQATYNIGRILTAATQIKNITTKNPSAVQPGGAEALAASVGMGGTANLARNADRQIVYGAQKDALDAMLYLATGAAYNKEQLEGQIAAYIPAYTDKPETVAAKKVRMTELIKSAKTRAGKAWTPEMDNAIKALTSSSAPPAAPQGTSGFKYLGKE
jgi:hypothetical protein